MNAPTSRPAAAWLRLLPATDALRIGLLQTDVAGEPISFTFANGHRPQRDSSGGQGLNAAISDLMRQGEVPTLVIAKRDELSEPDSLDIGLPIYCVADSVPGAWATPATEDARRTLATIEGVDAFEPLARTGEAIDAAFADRRVSEMMAIRGLATVVTLPISEARGSPSDASSFAASGLRDELVACLRRILAPAQPPPSTTALDALPLSWPNELMPFQQDGVRTLLGMDRLLLADDMGLGKTIQAVAALRILKARGMLGRALVIAPTSVLDQWRREIAKWAPELSAIIIRGAAVDRIWQWRAATDVALASYGVLRADAWRAEVSGRVWDAVIADEAQRIKNRVETSAAVKSLRRCRSWALTGTPIENREEELASIMEFVDHDGSEPLKRYSAGETLLARHRELQLRRRKDDVLDDLPEKLVTKLTIDLHPAQRASYDRAEQDGTVYLKSLGTEVSIVHILELITRLKQICNADPKTGASCKLDDIDERIQVLAARGHKALVFSQYTSKTAGVAAAAQRLSRFQPLVLTGATPIADRPALIKAFRTQEAHSAMIVSLRVGGVGLNLQEASYVFHLDRWWNPAVERQAEDRTHRMGQTVKVHVVKYACRNTIEERIDDILATKQELFDELVDDVSLDLSARLSREDLLGLFGL